MSSPINRSINTRSSCLVFLLLQELLKRYSCINLNLIYIDRDLNCMMNKTPPMISGSGKDGLIFPSVDGKSEVRIVGDHAQLLCNFKDSGKPVRFMMYKDGSWVNFEEHVMDVLVSAFVSGKAMIEVEMEGFKLIIDFYRMLGIDLDTGNELPISWIDVNGKYFLPKIFIEDSENLDKNGQENVNENLSAGGKLGKKKRGNEENEVGSSSKNVKERRVVATPTEMLPPKWPRTRSMRDEEYLYKKVKGLLTSLSGAGVTITAVHQCMRTGPMEQARYEVFQENARKVTRARGNPRVVYAWYGTSSKNVESIMRRGFEMHRIVLGSYPRGVGIYLSPFYSPQNSNMMSEIDENGEKHMILCQVILGNLEKVKIGSKQLFRSNANFDSGVDDLINPKLYVVWCGNMNTHILPDCIVSYKSDRHLPGGQIGGAHSSDRWSRLLSKLHSLLPLPKKLELQSLNISFGEGKFVGKEILLRQIRAIVEDDQLIRSLMLELLS